VALLLCAAAGITVQQLTPAPDDTVGVVAATRDLAAGKTLDRADLALLNVPRGLLPGGSFSDTALLQGKQLAIPLRQGQLISDSQLLGPGLLAGNPPGSAAVPLRMADPSSIQLVSPGQLINVVLSGGNGYEQPASSEVLAAAVPVLWTSRQGGKAAQWLGDGETDGLIVVAADADQSRRLAGASTQGKLFFVLVAPPPG
jgi:pilus assembly protein CpaB